MTADKLSSADRDLWQSAIAGDASARQELVERAWQLCALRLRKFPADEIEEIRQRIAVSMLRAIDAGIVVRSHLDGLLEWRGRAEITAFVRQKIRERRVEAIGDALDQAGFDPTPFDCVSAAELLAHLRDCIDRIPNGDHRDAARGRFVRGWTSAEIAAQRSIPPRMARLWLSRGAALVRACVERKLGRGKGS